MGLSHVEAGQHSVSASGISLRTPLHLWHLSSLDAPTVTVVWIYFLGRPTHSGVTPATVTALFAVVWIIYSADRLLDAFRSKSPLQLRHRFHTQHRKVFLLGITVAFVLLGISLVFLPPLIRTHLLLLSIPLAVYAVLVHFAKGVALPKEMMTGIFFGLAVAIAAHVSLYTALPLAALCALNCFSITAWEEHPYHSRTALVVSLAAFCFVCLALQTAMGLACALSGLALLLLHFRKPADTLTLRATADLALLTPLMFLFWRA